MLLMVFIAFIQRPLREFFGEEVKSVVATTGRPMKVLEGESLAHAILEFDSGRHASFQATVRSIA